MPDFSIITITYNNRDGLSRTAASIQAQTYTNFEWIIVDGASIDGTAYDLINYKAATIVSEPDKGIYDAMNKGIEKSIGDYIIFMNAGDIFASSDILEMISNQKMKNDDFIYGDSIEDNHLKHSRPYSKIKWGMFTHHQAMFYNRIKLGKLRYDLNYRIAADYDLTLRFLKDAKHIRYIPIPICVFEMGGVSQTNANLGRDEQFISRQKNKNVTTFVNHGIRMAQILGYVIREKCPELYWALSKIRKN